MTDLLFPIKGRITQRFGRPALKVEPTMYGEKDAEGWKRCRPTAFEGGVQYQDFHPGTDVSCAIGTPVLAPADGKVVAVVEYRVYCPPGIRPELPKGGYVTGLYAQFRYDNDGKQQGILHVDHLLSARPVGTKVERGRPWARTGNSGISTGPHAHAEDRVGPSDDHWSESRSWFRRNIERTMPVKE